MTDNNHYKRYKKRSQKQLKDEPYTNALVTKSNKKMSYFFFVNNRK